MADTMSKVYRVRNIDERARLMFPWQVECFMADGFGWWPVATFETEAAANAARDKLNAPNPMHGKAFKAILLTSDGWKSYDVEAAAEADVWIWIGRNFGGIKSAEVVAQ